MPRISICNWTKFQMFCCIVFYKPSLHQLSVVRLPLWDRFLESGSSAVNKFIGVTSSTLSTTLWTSISVTTPSTPRQNPTGSVSLSEDLATLLNLWPLDLAARLGFNLPIWSRFCLQCLWSTCFHVNCTTTSRGEMFEEILVQVTRLHSTLTLQTCLSWIFILKVSLELEVSSCILEPPLSRPE